MSTPHSTSHAGPGLFEGKNAFNIIAADLLTGDWVNDSGLNAEERQGRTSGLGRGNTTQGSDDV